MGGEKGRTEDDEAVGDLDGFLREDESIGMEVCSSFIFDSVLLSSVASHIRKQES